MIRSIVVLTIVISANSALADDSAATLEQMVNINRKALDQLKAGKKEEARDALLEAVWLGQQAGLGNHQMMARTYLHLGAVYLTGFGYKEKAVQQLEAALRIKPTIQLTPQLVTPALEEAFQIAQGEVPGVQAALAHAAPPPPPAPKPSTKPAPPKAVAPAPRPTLPDVPTANVDVATTVEVERVPGTSPIWVGLGVGTGVGWHGRRDLESQNDYVLPAGLGATAVAHLAPELGYRLNERIAVSVQSRHQIIPKVGFVPGTRSRFAHAVFLRGHGLLTSVRETMELWGTFAVGGGSAFRLYVPRDPAVGLGGSDTISAGPVAFGPGISLVFRPGGPYALLGEARMLAAVPRFAALVDLTLSGRYTF
jgi:hypothetical protein